MRSFALFERLDVPHRIIKAPTPDMPWIENRENQHLQRIILGYFYRIFQLDFFGGVLYSHVRVPYIGCID